MLLDLDGCADSPLVTKTQPSESAVHCGFYRRSHRGKDLDVVLDDRHDLPRDVPQWSYSTVGRVSLLQSQRVLMCGLLLFDIKSVTRFAPSASQRCKVSRLHGIETWWLGCEMSHPRCHLAPLNERCICSDRARSSYLASLKEHLV
jgi:hypothetical protein